ncbi:TIGR02611 family protein [Nocardia brevicatena]|uniref:TIGR02611 family protein n=1 Tax=Nocardia brevicatena TaxID=37327 RepID=UPI0002E36645|nr:TIGR02611 family protein [Nocardia brevicatena]
MTQPHSDEEQTPRREPNAWRAFRDRIAARPAVDLVYRTGVAIVGTTVLVVGILAIPYPGPGWAMVFAGLGILATEFAAARRVLTWVRDKYRRGMAWYIARGPLTQAVALLATGMLVVVTLWILGTFGLIGGWIGIEWQWLRSPLMS